MHYIMTNGKRARPLEVARGGHSSGANKKPNYFTAYGLVFASLNPFYTLIKRKGGRAPAEHRPVDASSTRRSLPTKQGSVPPPRSERMSRKKDSHWSLALDGYSSVVQTHVAQKKSPGTSKRWLAYSAAAGSALAAAVSSDADIIYSGIKNI